MAKVYAFPVKKRLPDEAVDCLYKIADAYVKTLNYAMVQLASDEPTNAELEEIRDLVVLTYAKGLEKAVDNMGL